MEQINEYIVEVNDINSEFVLMGNDSEAHKTVLIKTNDVNTIKLKTDNLVLKTGVEIEYQDGKSMGHFHILQCISPEIAINNQFARICAYAFAKITSPMTMDYVVSNFQNMQQLFETSIDKNSHELQVGIYGELLFLQYLNDNELPEIAKKWHSNFYTKHDIEIDEKHRIEVKTTNKEKRIHKFKHNQLVRDNVEVYIASIMLEETETGYSLYNLMVDTIPMLDEPKQKLEIEKLMRICNLSEDSQGITCDRQHVYNDIRFYEAINVPKILSAIPDGVSSVQYDVSLETSESTNISILKKEIY